MYVLHTELLSHGCQLMSREAVPKAAAIGDTKKNTASTRE